MHYTPTSSSWMNLVERFFRDLTQFITEKSFASTRELADAIIAFWRCATKIPADTYGKPRARTSCARSTPPDKRCAGTSQKGTLFQRQHTSLTESQNSTSCICLS